MFQVIVMWNLARPDQELYESVNNITLRGYNEKAFITGEFAWKINEDEIIKPLSVSNIADKYCPTRRDLYLRKGVNRLTLQERRGRDTWGSKAGILVEDYIMNIIGTSETITNSNYSDVIEISERNHNSFINRGDIEGLARRLEELEIDMQEERGNTKWLKKLLRSNGRAEFALNYLNGMLKDDVSIDDVSIIEEDILTGNSAKIDVAPATRLDKIKKIGINLPSTPDFIIHKYGIVGDIKTGIEFKSHFQLTCAGYALAYENVMGISHNINWGIIYFFPTRNPSFFRKSVTFAQVYIFPIDDYLRREFLSRRNEAYNIISKEDTPSFPKESEREHCKRCKFKDICVHDGLSLEAEE